MRSLEKMLAEQKQERARRVKVADAGFDGLPAGEVVAFARRVLGKVDATDLPGLIEHAVALLTDVSPEGDGEGETQGRETIDVDIGALRARKLSARQWIIVALKISAPRTTGGIKTLIKSFDADVVKSNNMGSDVKRTREAGYIVQQGTKKYPGRTVEYPLYRLTEKGESAAAALIRGEDEKQLAL